MISDTQMAYGSRSLRQGMSRWPRRYQPSSAVRMRSISGGLFSFEIGVGCGGGSRQSPEPGGVLRGRGGTRPRGGGGAVLDYDDGADATADREVALDPQAAGRDRGDDVVGDSVGDL